ncbi:MAG TPA: alginate O-acetyltransferase, partial [Pseudomonadales bacterium]|nr:alginate O-acetyltransferase [Pseudomonadales bacterium]
WAAIDLLLFSEGRDGVVIGKHAWLFSDEEIDLSKNANENYKRNLAAIIASKELLSKNNITLVIAIIPAKSRIYSSYLQDTPPSDLHKQLYALIHKDLAESNILAPDLLNPLLKHSKSNFLKTDTHWTPDGAEITAKNIAEFINKRKLLDISTKEFVTQATGKLVHRGDLLNYLPLQPWFNFLYPYTDSVEVRKTTLLQTSDNVADMLFSANDIAVDLVGTSYSANSLWNFNGALQQALGTDVLNMAKEGQGPIKPMQTYLNERLNKPNLPKLVIWEIPERYLLMDNG